jgi:hypothetical protein
MAGVNHVIIPGIMAGRRSLRRRRRIYSYLTIL